MSKIKLSILKASLIFVGLLLFAAVMMIILGPVVPDDKQLKSCVVNIHLPVGGLSMNCDSPEFLRLATDPGGLFEPKNDRQSRPGYIMAAWLVSRPFLPAAFLAEKIGFKAMREAPVRFTKPLYEYFPAYIGYVLLDIFFIWFSARIFWALFADEQKKISLPVFIFSLILVFNDIFFSIFWSPHTQFFNIFVPMFCLWAGLRAYQGSPFLRKNFILFSFLAGLGILAYTNFCLFFPAVIIGNFFRERKVTPASLLRYLISACLLALPVAAWYLIVILKNGHFFNCEIDVYNYGIWNQASNFADVVRLFYQAIYNITINLFTKNLYIFLPGIISAAYLWRKDPASRPILLVCILQTLGFILFFDILTFYPDRVLLSLALPWLIPLTIIAEKKLNARLAPWAAILFVSGWIVWMYFMILRAV